MINRLIEWWQDRHCNHNFRRFRTIHGDERNMGKLSQWQCSKCDAHRYSESFDRLEGRNGKWWEHE